MIGAVIFLLLLIPAIVAGFRMADGWHSRSCVVFLAFTSEIFLLAQAASLLGQLGNPAVWLVGASIFSAAAYLLRGPLKRPKLGRPGLVWLTLVPVIVLVFLGGLSRAPGNWDGVSYQLPRALYYLQFGSFSDFPTPTATQVFHPLLGPVWHIFLLIAGANNERLLFLPQFFAWLLTAAALIGFTDSLSPLRKSSLRHWLVAAFALLPAVTLLEADTEKTDILLGAYAAIAFFFAVNPQRFAGALSLLSFAFALAVKASALPLAPLWLLAIAMGWKKRKAPAWSWALAFAVFLLVTLSSGYARNFQRYGALMGPPPLLAQYEFSSAQESLREGSANLFRYLIDAGTPDGWPGIKAADTAVAVWRTSGNSVAKYLLGRSLEQGRTFGGFVIERGSLAHEDAVSFGFAYFWITVAATLWFFARERRNRLLLAGFGATLYVLLFHSYLAVYDQWHGRFFIVGIVFLAPFLALSAESWLRVRSGRLMLGLLLPFLFMQSVYMIANRNNVGLAGQPSRIAQVLRDRAYLAPVFEAFEKKVPESAVLATKLSFAQPEYLLFGPNFARTVIPTWDFQRGELALPPGAEWLLFNGEREKSRPGDEALGEDYFLRRLEKR